MTPGAVIRSMGFRSLLVTDGEGLTLESEDAPLTVRALVKRNMSSDDIKRFASDGAVDFSPAGMTMVEFLVANQAVYKPEAGQALLDGNAVRHRISHAIRTDITWQCLCRQSEVVA